MSAPAANVPTERPIVFVIDDDESLRDALEDLLNSGIGDPTMVTRSALQNAASIAKNILTTEAIVAEAPEKAGAGMGGGMPDMGGMM